MKIQNKLIVSPTNLKFQAPFPHNQKRQLSLLNVSHKDLVYNIELENDALFQVIPSSGKLAKYNTIELTVLMKPAYINLESLLRVQYKDALEETSNEEDLLENSNGDWSEAKTTQVKISLENCVEDDEEFRRMFDFHEGAENMAKFVEEKYQPVCTNCCLKRTNPRVLAGKTSWPWLLFWPSCIMVFLLAVCLGCYFFGLNLSAEKDF